MTRISQRVVVCCATGLLAALFVCGLGVAAQDKDKKTDKKEVKKVDKKEEKKTDKGKKEEKKKEEKKKEDKKKEEYKPDQPQVEIKAHKDWIYVVAFGTGGKTLASASRDRSVKIWDLGTKKDVLTLRFPGEGKKGDERRDAITSMAYQHDLVYAGGGRFDKKAKAWVGEIKIWDAKPGSGKEIKSLKGHSDEITCLAVDKEGKTLYSGSKDNTIIIWDIATGKPTNTIKAHTAAVKAVALNKDGTMLASAGEDGTVKLWDKGGKEYAAFKVEVEAKIKDAKTKKEKIVKEAGRAFLCVAFSPDSKRVAAGNYDGFIKVYNVAEKKEVLEFKGLPAAWAVAYRPDGSQLAASGYEGLIKVWDTAGKEMRTIKAGLTDRETITTLSFSPDGTQFASGGLDGLIKLWSVGAKK